MLTEAALHALPYSTGYGATQVDSEHPIGHGTPDFRYTYSRDWSFHLANSGTLNNEGFRASQDYRPDPQGLAVVGNSFVQADAVLPADAMTERIGALLHRNAVAVGGDGFSIADYAVRARPGAPVALPIDWKELKDLKSPGQFTMKDVLTRLKRTRKPVPVLLPQTIPQK